MPGGPANLPYLSSNRPNAIDVPVLVGAVDAFLGAGHGLIRRFGSHAKTGNPEAHAFNRIHWEGEKTGGDWIKGLWYHDGSVQSAEENLGAERNHLQNRHGSEARTGCFAVSWRRSN